ncbi:MAG: zinc ribbon domain-containing protein [Lachnospiraceae bacterium]|nr:zinc ribbon domain-containing protein [Lachnospiraceae bacterium]
MYECPNCAGNLKFDISRQQLYCEYCGTQVDPYCFYKERDAKETEQSSGEYEATVFTCPQCGAELISEDTTAATFCSFCGGSAILDSRIGKERRPGYIIPFTKTKEDCRAAYKKLLRRAVFAPKELKNETLIEKFRGIYMPYWVYSFEKNGPVTFTGKKTYRKGDYQITDHYRLDCEIEETYKGLAYDASSTFSDSLSSAIAPFDLKKRKEFVPAFLSGFYADTSDVNQYVYQAEAEELVLEDAGSHLVKDPVCRGCHAGKKDTQYALWNALRPSERAVELAMLPVWFLSCRNGGRVIYAAVNGQTGKAAADLPVDEKRYLAGSFFLAVPLFFLLNLFLTVTPGRLLLIAGLLAFLCILISNAQLSHILARESGADDRGLSSVNSPFETENSAWKIRKRIQMPWAGSMGIMFGITVLFYGTALLPTLLFHRLHGRISMQIVSLATVILPTVSIGFAVSMLKGRRERGRFRKKPFGGGHFREKWPVLKKPLAGIVLAAVILLLNPVSDWFYYIGAFGCMSTVLWGLLDMIRQHNRLTTRKLPQLGRRGGDEIEPA